MVVWYIAVVVGIFVLLAGVMYFCNGCNITSPHNRRKPEDNPSVYIVGSREQRAAARVAARAGTPSTSGRMSPSLGMHTPPPAYSVVWPGDDPRLHGPDSFAPPSYSEAMGTSPDVRVV